MNTIGHAPIDLSLATAGEKKFYFDWENQIHSKDPLNQAVRSVVAMAVAENQTQQTPNDSVPEEQVQAFLEAARYADQDDLMNLAFAGIPLDSRDSQGRTALHMAAANGHLEIVEYLIRSGADVNASNTEKNTPLHFACLNGHSEVIRNLILAGADVAALNSHEKTPMDEAMSNGKMEVVDAINAASSQVELGAVNIS